MNKENRAKAKKLEYNFRKRLVSWLPPLDKEKYKVILVNRLGVQAGDHVFVHGSLGMIRTALNPLELLEMLLEIVGPDGSVSAPTFIRDLSKEWMKMEKPFNAKRTPSGMGLLSERIRRYKGSKRSLHPTKSVATIGKIADLVLGGHHLFDLPFGPESPFVKLLEHDVKVIGIGVPMSYLSMVHTVEECNRDAFPVAVNEPKVYEKKCVTVEGKEHIVRTHVHDLAVVARANPEKFVRKYVKKEAYTIYNHYLSPFFLINGKELYEELERQMRFGNTIYD